MNEVRDILTAVRDGKLDVEEALFRANHTAALTVSRMGASSSIPTLDEVCKG